MKNKMLFDGKIESNDILKKRIKEIGEWLKETDFNVDIENKLTTSIDINIHINPQEVINCDIIQNFCVGFKAEEENEE